MFWQCPKNLRVISLSIDGCPVPIEDAPGQRPDSDKVLVMGIWRTDTHFATDVSKREKLEVVFVAQVDGCSGPESDERHLLKKKLLAKFYSPDYHKYTEKVTAAAQRPRESKAEPSTHGRTHAYSLSARRMALKRDGKSRTIC